MCPAKNINEQKCVYIVMKLVDLMMNFSAHCMS